MKASAMASSMRARTGWRITCVRSGWGPRWWWGGAYLPLDPAYPCERLAFMLGDAGAQVLITHSSLRPRLPASAPRTLCLDAEAATLAALPATAPAVDLDPNHPAYVIYTSGSTGTPKGVLVDHAAIGNYVAWGIPTCGLGVGIGAPV